MAAAAMVLESATEARQVERYTFTVRFPGTDFPPITVDEPAPTGANRGPNPARMLAASVAHCMSSTLYNCLERSHVPSLPVTTTVRVEVGRNARGRQRVVRLGLTIETAPLNEEDRPRFEHCVSTFEDFCTVSGAVREGIPIDTQVRRPGAGSGPAATA